VAKLRLGPCGEYRENGLTKPILTGVAVEKAPGTVFISIQNGSGTATYDLDPEYNGVTAYAFGTVETLDPGFDWIRVTVDDEQILYLQSTKDGDCSYESKSGTGSWDKGNKCKPCPIKILIEAAPGDNICNDGVEWTVNITAVK